MINPIKSYSRKKNIQQRVEDIYTETLRFKQENTDPLLTISYYSLKHALSNPQHNIHEEIFRVSRTKSLEGLKEHIETYKLGSSISPHFNYKPDEFDANSTYEEKK